MDQRGQFKEFWGFGAILFFQTLKHIFIEKVAPKTQKLLPLKVSYPRKQILNFSFEQKNQQKYFCISALASKSGRIKKISDKYMINSIRLVFQCFYLLFRPLFKGFLKLGKKRKNISVGFLVQMKTLKFAFEIK